MEMNHLTEKARRDYELIQLALNKGDQAAYSDLMNNYRDSLYFMLLKMTNNPVDADDLTIEAFSKAFQNLHQYTPEFAFSTWLFRIASNNCIDFLRKNKNRTLSIDEQAFFDDESDISERFASSQPDPEETIIRTQKIETMRAVVDKLKPHYRTLVEMRYFQELSYEEIADQLQLPLGTVKAKLFRARDLLYHILKSTAAHI